MPSTRRASCPLLFQSVIAPVDVDRFFCMDGEMNPRLFGNTQRGNPLQFWESSLY